MMKKWKRTAAVLTAAATALTFPGNLYAGTHNYNDPYSLAEHYLIDTGVSSVIADKHTSTQKVKVAMFDSGFDYNHADLESVWVQDKQVFDKLVGTDTACEHGTACASVLAMVVDNEIGGAGVCPDVELYPISFMTDGIKDYYPNKSQDNELDDVLMFCIENNIKILSVSLNNAFADTETLDKFKAMGGIIVCSAGNSGQDNDTIDRAPSNYIKDYDNMLVCTSTYDGKYSEWANYGKNTVSLASPGEAITCAKENDSFSNADGTSFSAPYVAGVVALLSSYYPEATMEQIREAIMEGVDKKADLKDRCISGGSVNAKKALEILQKKLGCEVEEGEYYIRNNDNGKYLTCYGNGTGTNVSTVNFFNYESNEQKWRVEYTNDNKYVIFPASNQNNCLEVYNNQCSEDGNNVWQNGFSEAQNQKWELEKQADGSFKILSAGDDTYGISASNMAKRDNGMVNQDTLALENTSAADAWTFEKIDDLYSDPCYINIGEKYMNSSSNAVMASDFYNTASEKWTFKYRGNGYYTINPQGNEWTCLEVSDGSKLQLNGYQGESAKQLWKIVKNDEESVRIESKLTDGLSLSLDDSSNIALQDFSSSNTNQIINLEEVDSILQGTFAIRNAEADTYLKSKSADAKSFFAYNQCISSTKVKFIVDYIGNGYYTFTPYDNHNLRLDAYNGDPHDNWAVWQYQNNGSIAQHWKLTQNEDNTYTIASRIDENYVWNYYSKGGTRETNNMFSVHTRDESANSQEWYLEDFAKTFDGKSIATQNSLLTGSVLEYIGNGRYMLAKDGKYFTVYEPSDEQREELTSKGVLKSCMKYIHTGSISVTDKNGWFAIRQVADDFYIIPNRYLYTGVNHDARNEYLDVTNAGLRWSLVS